MRTCWFLPIPFFAMARKTFAAFLLALAACSCVGGSPPNLPLGQDYFPPSHLMMFSASPDGKWIAAFAADGTLLLWDTHSWHLRRIISNYPVSLDALTFSPNSSRLVMGDAKGLIQFLEPYSGTVVKRLQDRDWVEECEFSSDGTRLATLNHKGITVWDIDAGRELEFFPEEKSQFSAFALNHDGSLLIAGTEDGKIQIWNVDSARSIATMTLGTHDWTNFLAVDEQRRLLLSAQGQGDISIWDLSTQEIVKTLKGNGEQVDWLLLMPEKHTVFSVVDDGRLDSWDYLAGHLRSKWKVPRGFVTDGGDRLVSEDPKAENRIQVWQIASKRLLKTLTYVSSDTKR